jgi:hypothetical protein
MARETKAQRLEREAAFRLQQEEENRNTYFPRVMKALEAASDLYWDISVKDGMFVVRSNSEVNEIPAVYSDMNFWKLNDLESDIEGEQFRQAEARRQIELRNNALAKLTPEEVKALGL